MSKNPAIHEGGTTRVFSGIRKLFTRQSGSDDMITWVPESDRQLTTKHITQNGVYRAADDGYYAYSSVTVSVPTDTGVTGEGEDGEQHYVAPDPETGELVDEVIPSSIVVETPPTNPYGIYKDGQAIGKDGMVVKAYLASGELYTGLPDGIVPNEQITLVPDKAEYDASSDTPARIVTPDYQEQGSVSIQGGCTVQQMISYFIERQAEAFTDGTVGSTVFEGDTNLLTEIVGPANAKIYTVNFLIANNAAEGYAIDPDIVGESLSIPTNCDCIGKFNIAWRSTGTHPNYIHTCTVSLTSALSTQLLGYIGTKETDTGVYLLVETCGLNATYIQAGSHQNIAAEWPRPGDGVTLSDAFEILVAPPIYGGGEA